MEKEIWKKIDWSPDYEISNYGRIKSYKHDKINGKLRKLRPDPKRGYVTIRLPNIYTGQYKRTGIHRLVAESFIPNPDNKEQVNHIDENKANNYFKNLEWTTSKENCNHGTRNERLGESQREYARQTYKKARCIETGEVYYSTGEGHWKLE